MQLQRYGRWDWIIWRQAGAGPLRGLPHSHVCCLRWLTERGGAQAPRVPAASPYGYLGLLTWQLHSPRASIPRDQASECSRQYFHFMLLTSPGQRVRMTRGLSSRKLCFMGKGAVFGEKQPQAQKFLRDVQSHMCMGRQEQGEGIQYFSSTVFGKNKMGKQTRKHISPKPLCLLNTQNLWTKSSIRKEESFC